ncbi:hypothetical protein HanPSC8_Chr09g0353041 [Helianthus annuus]|nr:hypothetical protein HanPSC8_Chr09g0353041 [Helianthus annuus]
MSDIMFSMLVSISILLFDCFFNVILINIGKHKFKEFSHMNEETGIPELCP